MASLPLPTHSAAAASLRGNRRIPRATFVTPAPQLVSFGGGGLGSSSPQSSSAAASPSSSATTIFHHHVAKMRRVLGGAVASSITRHRWGRLLNIIRFAVRLRRVAQLGVKLTAFEREHLYKVYWEHSQRSGGLFDMESIARLLQEFNQPQPPTTVEQLLAHVHFRLPPTTNSKSGSSSSGRSQTPIAFYQVVQMLLHIKREHRALTQVSDEEELFLQLSSTGHANGGAEHQASDTAFHNNNSNMEHTLKPNSLLEVRPVVIAPTSRVDAAAVSSILSHFDLRVAPPELFVSNSVPASPSSVSKRSSGGDHTPPPSAGHDASSMLRYDDFQDFLQQRGVTATATGGGANDPSRRSSTASNNLTSPNGRSPVGGGRGGDDDFDEVFMLTGQQQQSTNGKFYLPGGGGGGRSGSPPNHVPHNSSGASSPHHLHASAAEPDGGGGGSTSAMVTARGSGGGSRLEELETAAEYQRLLYEGHSEQLLDMKKHVRRVERKHQAQVQAANNKMKSFEADVDRVKASGTWALQRHHQQQQQTTPNASTMMGTSSIGGVGSAQRHQRGARGSCSNNKGGTIQIVRVRPSSAIVSSTLSESAAQRLGNSNSTEAKQRSLDSGGSDRRRPMTAGPTKALFQQQQRVSPSHHRAVSPSSHPAVQQRLSPYRQQQQSHTGGAGGAPPMSPPRPTTHSRPHTAQPIIHGKQLFAQGTRQITASASQQHNNGGDDLSALSIRETTYHSHVPSIWVGSDPKSSSKYAAASSSGAGDDPNSTTVSTIAGAASTAAPSHHYHNSAPRSSAMNRIASHLSAAKGQKNRPMSAPLRAAHNNASGVQSSAATTVGQPPSYFRPGSASSIQKKLDLYIHPTPLVELAEAPPFRLSQKQQETMGTWYANEYARLLQRPHADNRPGTAPPQTNTAAPMAAHHAVALQNSKNAANPWAFQAATCTIASSVRQTLGHSQADVVNHNRSADYHRVNVLETYVDEHYHNLRDHTHPLLSQHPHSSVAAAAHHGEQQMAVVQHSRPVSHTSQSDGYYHHGSGEGGAYTPAQAFADRSWLRGSSFDTAKKLKPPPAGFVS